MSPPYSTLDERLGRGGGLVVIAPHPDDESLACGGIIAEARTERRPTRVIIVSDGTGSHPASKTYPSDRLRDLREEEAKQAVSELGLDPHRDIVFLRLPDRFVPSEGPSARKGNLRHNRLHQRRRGASAFCQLASRSALRSSGILRDRPRGPAKGPRAKTLRIYGMGFRASSGYAGRTVDLDGFRIRIDPHQLKKRRAIAAHRSQTTNLIRDDPYGFRLSESDLARFDLPYEFFFECRE